MKTKLFLSLLGGLFLALFLVVTASAQGPGEGPPASLHVEPPFPRGTIYGIGVHGQIGDPRPQGTHIGRTDGAADPNGSNSRSEALAAAFHLAYALSEPHILLEKNEAYYDAAGVVITEVTSLFIDADEAWTRYQSGELDTIAPPLSALDEIKASSVYSPQLHIYPRACTYYYGFSNDVPPFDDPLVRAAFASAIDRKRLIGETLSGDQLPALTFTAPGVFGHVDGYAAGIGRPYSPTLAVDLLIASGYAGTPTITLMYNTSSGNQAIAEAIRQMWIETLGITVTLQDLEWGSYLDLLRDGSAEERPGVYRLRWCADYPDANNWLNDVFHSGNASNCARYDNPAYDALVEAAAIAPLSTTRLSLYEQAEAYLVMTDTAIAPLYYFVNHSLTRPDLTRTYRSFGGQHLDEWYFTGDPRPLEIVWGDPLTLDPALATDTTSINYIEQLFLGLTDFDSETEAVVPELATGWDISLDGRVYTFTMRSDATWTDGNPVTADDVEYGVLRSLDPATGSGYAFVLYLIENAEAYNEGTITDPDLVGVEALDATHIRFTLTGPASYFPMIAGLWPARPQPQWAIEAHGDAWTDPDNIVTNGPYKLVAWEKAPEVGIWKWNTSGYARPGGVYVYGIYYRNDGEGVAENTLVVDTLPMSTTYAGDTSGLPHIEAGGVITWDLGTLESGEDGAFMLTLNVPETIPTGSEVIEENCVFIATTTAGDDDPDNDSSCAGPVDVWDDEVEIDVDKWVDPDDPTPGQEFNYTVRWCNNRGAAAGPVWLTDTLPLSTTLLSWNPEQWWQVFWTEVITTGGQLVLYAPGLPGHMCEHLSLNLLLDAGVPVSTTLENTVVVDTPDDVDPSNNQRVHTDAHVGPPRYDMRLDKSVHSHVPVPGGWINYFFRYENEGNMPTHIWIADTMPSGLSYDYAHWGGGQPQEGEPFPDPDIIGDQLVWDLGEVPIGDSAWFHVQMNITDTLSPGDIITNCATIGVDGFEDTPEDNTSCYPVTLNEPGPNLRVTKWHKWHGDGQLGYEVRFENIGDETVSDVWITDTLPISTTWDGWWDMGFDWDRLVSDTQSSDVLRWKFSDLYPGDSGRLYFNADLDAPGQPLRWYTNTVEIDIPFNDPNSDDNSYTDVAFSGGEVDDVEIWMNTTGDSNMWGWGESNVPITVTTLHTQVTTWADGDGNWWMDNVGPIYPGDTITVEAGSGIMPVVIPVPDPFTAEADSAADIVFGQIGGWSNEEVEVHGYWSGGYQQLTTDASGYYTATYGDVPRGAQGYVRFVTWINHAGVNFHRPFQTPDLIMNVNYAHEWVNGNYEAGHTVWITVTEGDGFTVKATAELTTGPIPEWGGQSGFNTHGEDWSPSHPDIQPGDWVYGLVNSSSYTTTVHVGTINGELDVDADTVSGTIHANWFTQMLNANCGVWEENGPGRDFTVDPDGGSYFCDFSSDWDLLPGQNVGVQYQEPDGDWVINVFQQPVPHLSINKWADGSPGEGGNLLFHVQYRNEGGAPAENTVITDTMLGGMTYITDTSGFPYTGSGSGPIVWDLGTVEPGDWIQFDVFVQVTAAQSETITNTAQIATSNPYDQGEESTWSGHVEANDTHLNVSKDAWTGDPAPDTDLVYRVSVCNNGSTASSQVMITDTLHPSMTLQYWWGEDPGWTEVTSSSNLLVVSRPSVPGWWCGHVYLRVHLDGSAWPGMYITNTAVISASNDMEDDDNEAFWDGYVNDPHTNLNINKWWTGGALVPGVEIHYNISYDNNGNVPVENVFITDTLPVSTILIGIWRYDRHWNEIGPVTPTLETPDYVVWEVGTVENGDRGYFDVELRVDDDAIPGTILTNTVEISLQPDEDDYDDNVATVAEILNPPGPNLRVTKSHDWNGDGQLGYQIRFENIGDETVSNVWITDTLPADTTWDGWWDMDFDWGRLVSDTQSSDVLRWKFSDLYPGDSGWLYFNADLDAPGQPLRWYTNTVEIDTPPNDTNLADNSYTDVAFSGGEVDWVDLYVGGNNIWGCAPDGPITITTAYAQMFIGDNCFNEWFDDPFQPGDVVTIEAGAALHPVVILVPDPFTAYASSITETVWGQIDHLDHEWVEVDLDGGPTENVQTDGSGNYSATFPDIPRGGQGEVRYNTEIDYADVTFHRRFQTQDLIINVNYGHDWVEGNYEAGHTVWITVTESDGFTIKATAELETQVIPWWGGRTGFSTNLDDPWVPDRPDIVAGDWVYGLVDNGYSSTVRVGTINGEVDVDADTVSGTIHANWFTQMLNANCGVWEENGPGRDFTVDPDGGSYFCDFSSDWDLLPGQNVGVQYQEPDGDWVINVFFAPYEPYVRVNQSHDWVDGRAALPNTMVTITVTDGGGVKGTYTDWSRGDGWFGAWCAEDEHGNCVDIAAGDTVYVEMDGTVITVPVVTMTGDVDAVNDTISGDIYGVGYPADVRGEVWEEDGPGVDGQTDEFGNYLIDFSPFDVRQGHMVALWYVRPDGHQVGIMRSELRVEMDISRDNLGGSTAPGATMAITVTGSGVKGTASTVADDEGGYWTEVYTDGERVDILPGDALTVQADGRTAELTIPFPFTAEYDHQANTVCGEASPGLELEVDIYGYGNRWVTVGPDGTYCVDFSDQGDPQIWDEGDVEYYNEDGHIARLRFRSPSPNLWLEKRGEGNPVAGRTYDWFLRYGNQGDAEAESVVMTDTLPAGVTFVSESTGTAIVVDNQVIWGLGTVAVGAEDIITLTVQVEAGLEPGTPLENCAALGTPTWERETWNNDSCDYREAVADEVDLWVNKDAQPGDPAAGHDYMYLISYGNDYPASALDVVITDTLPASTTLVSEWHPPGWAADTSTPGVVVWTMDELPGNHGWHLEMKLHVDGDVQPGTQLWNRVEIDTSATDVDPNNDWHEHDVWTDEPYVNLSLSKGYSHGSPVGGYEYTCWIRLENYGNMIAHGVVLTDTLPAGTTFVNAQRRFWNPSTGHDDLWIPIAPDGAGADWVRFALGDVVPWRSVVLEITVLIDGGVGLGTEMVNRVEVTSSEPETYPEDNVVEYAFTTQAPGPNVRAFKDFQWGDVAPGNTIEYWLHFDNDGTEPAENVVFTDTLPANVTYEGHGFWEDPTIVDNWLVWEVGTMNPGDAHGFWVQVRINDDAPAGAVLTNTAEVGTTSAEAGYGDNMAQVVQVVGPDLRVEKELLDEVLPGCQIRYRIRIRNEGDAYAHNAVLTDTLPAGCTYAWDWWDGEVQDGVVVWRLGDLHPGWNGDFEMGVNVGRDIPAGTVITNTLDIAGDEDDADPADNHFGLISTVSSPYRIRVQESHNWVDGRVLPDAEVVIILKDSEGVVKVTVSTWANEWGDFGRGMCDETDCYDIEVGDTVEVDTEGTFIVIEVVRVEGVVDAVANTIAGDIYGVGYPADVRGEVWEEDGPGVDGQTDAAGNYLIDFSPFDVREGHMVALWYVRPDGHQVGIVRYALRVEVDISHDNLWGNTAQGVTVAITVTGSGVKGTASTVADDEGNYWTEVYTDGERVDILPGDSVYAAADGQTAAVVIPDPFTAEMDVDADTVYGEAPAGAELQVHVYGYGDNKWVTVEPDSTWSVWFGDWGDLQAGDQGEVDYYTDEGHTVRVHFYGEVIIISDVKVTNVRDTSFTVSWVTDVDAEGEVHYGTDPANLDQIAYDDRWAATSDDTHYVTLQGLSPNTTYYFDVVSGSTTDDNGGVHYSVTTGPTLGLPASDTIYGQVFQEDGTTLAEGTIVYIALRDAEGSGSAGEAAPLSALVDNSGYWYANLGNARLADLSAYFAYSASGDRVKLEAQGAADGTGCLLVDTADDSPAADLILNVSTCLIEVEIPLQTGWNFISLPVSSTVGYTAQSLCEEINGQGGNVVEVDRWYASGWDGHVCGLPFNDFPIELGQGYFVKSDSASTWTVEGWPIDAGVPLGLQVGWNSIAVPHSDAYTAQGLCDEINEQCGEGTALEVDRWYASGWDGHICGLPFNNFAVEIGKGYFVKAGSAGVVTPAVSAFQSQQAEPALVALPEAVPATAVAIRDLQVSNLRDTAVTLSWVTDEPATGYILFGKTLAPSTSSGQALGRVAYDVRGPAVADKTHYVVLTGLAPETTYTFDIVSGAGVDDNGGAHYSVTTGLALDSLPESDTVYGQVFRADGVTPAVGSIVYLTLMNGDGTGSAGQAMLMSALVDADGYWQANLGNARLADGNDTFAYSAAGDVVTLMAQGAAVGFVTQTVDTGDLRPAAPLIPVWPFQLYLPLTSR